MNRVPVPQFSDIHTQFVAYANYVQNSLDQITEKVDSLSSRLQTVETELQKQRTPTRVQICFVRRERTLLFKQEEMLNMDRAELENKFQIAIPHQDSLEAQYNQLIRQVEKKILEYIHEKNSKQIFLLANWTLTNFKDSFKALPLFALRLAEMRLYHAPKVGEPYEVIKAFSEHIKEISQQLSETYSTLPLELRVEALKATTYKLLDEQNIDQLIKETELLLNQGKDEVVWSRLLSGVRLIMVFSNSPEDRSKEERQNFIKKTETVLLLLKKFDEMPKFPLTELIKAKSLFFKADALLKRAEIFSSFKQFEVAREEIQSLLSMKDVLIDQAKKVNSLPLIESQFKRVYELKEHIIEALTKKAQTTVRQMVHDLTAPSYQEESTEDEATPSDNIHSASDGSSQGTKRGAKVPLMPSSPAKWRKA